MLANKYKLIQQINNGTFGTIYKSENIRTKEMVAIKIELKTNPNKSLKNEAKVYQYLGKLEGFPELKWFGTTAKTNYLVINLLGNSLLDTIQYYKALSIKNVLVYGIQIMQRIHVLHDKLLLHRDIKPSNFIFGTKNETNKLYLVDFGFSKRYDYNGKHIPEKNITNIVGTLNFVSLNVHNLIEPTRRDDVESCIYVILTMLFGKLEWFNKTSVNDIIILKKQLLLVDEVPSFIKIMLCYIRSIAFDERPDYEYLIDLMVKELNNYSFKNNDKFEWS
jgi:serine/threonine protein kinase